MNDSNITIYKLKRLLGSGMVVKLFKNRVIIFITDIVRRVHTSEFIFSIEIED